jgi:hypothetical protein
MEDQHHVPHHKTNREPTQDYESYHEQSKRNFEDTIPDNKSRVEFQKSKEPKPAPIILAPDSPDPALLPSLFLLVFPTEMLQLLSLPSAHRDLLGPSEATQAPNYSLAQNKHHGHRRHEEYDTVRGE